MKKITIPLSHLVILKSTLRDQYVDGLVALFEGKEPKSNIPGVHDALQRLREGYYQDELAKSIPPYDANSRKLSAAEIRRYEKVHQGLVPANGLDHGYKDLHFEPITTLGKDYLNGLVGETQDKIRSNKTGRYRSWLEYLNLVLVHCGKRIKFD